MPVRVEIVHNLGEYMNKVADIAGKCSSKNMNPPILWFRGVNNERYSLIPSLFRKIMGAEKISDANYTRMHYAEDIRTQHYIAKNFHLLSSEPSSRVEWLEVMQHHQINTRVLDWSESSMHSLLFALETFFVDGKFSDTQSRRMCAPCVWVLNPKKLNQKILQSLAGDDKLQISLLEDLNLSSSETAKIMKHIQTYGDFARYAETEGTGHIDYILNLSSINDDIQRDRVRLKELLLNGEVINPYYYLISRIYSDGFVLPDRKLPPLCVVHPYHSERIRAQKGVFGVFPFYEEQKQDEILRKYGLIPDAMEHNMLAQDCLCKILIRNPEEIAIQLMENGLNDSWLYPEMPVVSSEIENHKIW